MRKHGAVGGKGNLVGRSKKFLLESEGMAHTLTMITTLALTEALTTKLFESEPTGANSAHAVQAQMTKVYKWTLGHHFVA